MGAIASGGLRVLNDALIRQLGIPERIVDDVTRREEAELQRRERLFRGNRPEPVIAGRTVIVVDDGLATGSTMLAAVTALRSAHPARIIVAVPVGATDTDRDAGLWIFDDDFHATVLLASRSSFVICYGKGFTLAHRSNTTRINPLRRQIIFHRFRTFLR